ncbi:thioesterase family protein [Streptomyces sp. NPDC005438]|uniref:acyl-CoA thioesterase n=1 Tax=Streptomyces sp. NPDC005438 TaxID=3156880 RepID=UPI0033B2992E
MGTRSDPPLVRMPLRVRYHECDPQGIVFNAHYLAWADMACFATLNTLFGSHQEVTGRGYDLVVAEATVRYLAPCRFDEELVVEARTERLGRTSLTLRFTVLREEARVAEVLNRYVWVDTASLRPALPPEDLRAPFGS